MRKPFMASSIVNRAWLFFIELLPWMAPSDNIDQIGDFNSGIDLRGGKILVAEKKLDVS
tara:strand:- start:330 stop:506 length:177 start_codon:yes stop_codon:yes gene_type:complete